MRVGGGEVVEVIEVVEVFEWWDTMGGGMWMSDAGWSESNSAVESRML
jgi:hypothetical protein